MDLILFTTIGGFEIIGKATDVAYNGTTVTVEHPLVVRPIQKTPGEYALDLFPHSLANPEGEHKFFVSSFISQSVNVPEPLAKAYQQRTSNIIIASALDDLERMK